MTLKADFKLADIEQYVLAQKDRAEKALIRTLEFAGERFVIDARINGDYQDQTGNLRSSIGYVIIKDGQQITDNFSHAGVGTDGSTGTAMGSLIAEEVAAEFPKGINLICVAGMNYAAAVESKGYDVITGSSLEIKSVLQDLLKAL
jgi:hypothetical protein